MKTEILFKEQQRFRQWWLWALIGILVLIVGTVACILLQHAADNAVPLLLILLSLLLPVSFLLLRLDTEVRNDGIYVRFFPLQIKYKRYRWEDIDYLFIRQYDPVNEYGGWGIRGLGSNRALNISGDQGLQLVLKEHKKKLLIGTRKPEELARLIQSIPVPQ